MDSYILSDNPGTAQQVRDILQSEGENCPPEHVFPLDNVDEVAQAHPDLVALVLTPNPDRALGIVERVYQHGPAPILAIGPGRDTTLVLRAVHAGIGDFVDESNLEDDLRDSLFRRRARGGRFGSIGKVIALLNLGCGTGTSTLAANLAVALASMKCTPLLIDLRLPIGDLAALLDITPSHTLTELCQSATNMDRSMLERSLESHGSGVKLLASSLYYPDQTTITAEGVRAVLRLSRRMFSHVIADIDSSLGPEQREVITTADIVFVVLQLQFTCLRRACRTLEYLERIGVPRERIRVVVNRYGQGSEVPAAQAEKALGQEISHYVPDDPRTVNKAGNEGIPLVVGNPRARISRSLAALAASLNDKGDNT